LIAEGFMTTRVRPSLGYFKLRGLRSVVSIALEAQRSSRVAGALGQRRPALTWRDGGSDSDFVVCSPLMIIG
jgi:hypothetical protein